jgi:hypothetical protein
MRELRAADCLVPEPKVLVLLVLRLVVLEERGLVTQPPAEVGMVDR